MTRGVSERAPSREACASSSSFVWFQGSDESQESPPSSHVDPPRRWRQLPGDELRVCPAPCGRCGA